MHGVQQVYSLLQHLGVASPDPVERRAHVKQLVLLGIQHPEDLADVRRHLAKSFVALFPTLRQHRKRALSFFGCTAALPKIEKATEHDERHRGRLPVARQRSELKILVVARRKKVSRTRTLTVIDALPCKPHNFNLAALQQPSHEACALEEGTKQVDRYFSGLVPQRDPAVGQEDNLTLDPHEFAGVVLVLQIGGRNVHGRRNCGAADVANGLELYFFHASVLGQLAVRFHYIAALQASWRKYCVISEKRDTAGRILQIGKTVA